MLVSLQLYYEFEERSSRLGDILLKGTKKDGDFLSHCKRLVKNMHESHVRTEKASDVLS